MTIDKLLEIIEEEKPNTFIDDKLIEFVNEIEVQVAEQLRLAAEDIPHYEDTSEDRTKELLAPEPYDRLYISFLKMKIDYSQEEYASYQLNMEQHEIDFNNYCDFVVREGKAVPPDKPLRFKGIFR